MDDGPRPEDIEELTVHFRRSPLRGESVEARTCYLVMIEGEEPGRRIRFGAEPLVIGRVPPADLVLHDTEVSRRHCTVQTHPTFGVVVSDLNSTNGTFINGEAVTVPVALAENARLQIGRHVFRSEWLSAAEANRLDAFNDDLRHAREYVRALLPAPITDGPVRASWEFIPSAHLGGDAFGYQWLDERHFSIYLIDVSGHGPGAALHSASIMNVLRNRTLPSTSFDRPVEVVSGLNAAFPMDGHGGMCFSFWYGVFDRITRCLDFCSAGHHPAFLADREGSALQPLRTRNPLVGVMPGHAFRGATVEATPGSRLHVFSDGVFELRLADGSEGSLDDFVAQLRVPFDAAGAEPGELLACARRRSANASFEDDFTLLCLRFY